MNIMACPLTSLRPKYSSISGTGKFLLQKGHSVNTLGFAGYSVSAIATPFCFTEQKHAQTTYK